MAATDYALVVGIDRYPAPTLGSLKGAEADAKEFHRWVTDPGGGDVPLANAACVVSSLYQPAPNVNDELPAKLQIENFFTLVADRAQANLKTGRRLYMFFAGHGFAPTLNKSAVLMANATDTMPHNIAPFLWADRLYLGGWFDEVLLFQDACRSRIDDVDLTPPFLKLRTMRGEGNRGRFYAFAAKNQQLAQEKPDGNGQVHGVFSATLLEGLHGAARDPGTGEITTAQLKNYLQDNMRKRLSEADLRNDDIAKRPEVYDPDPFVIVPGVPGARTVPCFPIRVSLPRAGLDARIEDSSLAKVAAANPALQVWDVMLPRGLYRVVVPGFGDGLFQVTGALQADGTQQVVNVGIR
jgi:uncharacterized caspase-like protein